MRIDPNRNHGSRLMAKAIGWANTKAVQLFHPETRAAQRENAIRRTIASLVEIERMRLAFIIARRHDG